GTMYDQLHTFLPWAPRTTVGNVPLGVAWVVPLVDEPHRTPTNGWYDDTLAEKVSPTGRLGTLVTAGHNAETQAATAGKHAAIGNVPVTWAIDPMLATDVRAMTTPYTVNTATGTTRGTGTTNARNWLSSLRGATTAPRARVLPLPYGDPDLVPEIRRGLA